jgi:HK97 gp10 family phage protein
MFTIKMSGFEELEKALRKLPEEIAGKVMAQALRDAAKPMEAAAQQEAPRSSNPGKHGHMADSIKLRKMKPETGDNDVEITYALGPDGKHFYGLFSEFGTVHQQAQPFMRPAFDEYAEATIHRYGVELGKRIEAAATRLNRK